MRPIICIFFAAFISACNFASEVSEGEYKPRYNEFYNFAKDKETWLIDTLFLDISSVDLRYEHGGVFNFKHRICKGKTSHLLPIIIKGNNVYIGNLTLDSFYTKTKQLGCEFEYDFSCAKDIIKLLEVYRIGNVRVDHEKRNLWVDFFERGDSIINMYYTSTEEVHRISSDSSCVMKGWSIYKEKKKSDEQLYN